MQQVLEAVREVAVYIVTGVLCYIAVEFRKTRLGIGKLNLKLAVIIEKVQNHEKAIDRHDERLSHLERVH